MKNNKTFKKIIEVKSKTKMLIKRHTIGISNIIEIFS